MLHSRSRWYQKVLGFRPSLDRGSILPVKELGFLKNAEFVHIFHICDDFKRVVARHFQLFYVLLPFVELDGVRLDVHGGVVSKKEF